MYIGLFWHHSVSHWWQIFMSYVPKWGLNACSWICRYIFVLTNLKVFKQSVHLNKPIIGDVKSRSVKHFALGLPFYPRPPMSDGIAPALVWVGPLVGMGLILYSEVNTYRRRICKIWMSRTFSYKIQSEKYQFLGHFNSEAGEDGVD